MRFLEPNASCDEPPSRAERALRVVERLVLASGLVLFGVLFAQLGIHDVLAYLHLVGWGIVVIIVGSPPDPVAGLLPEEYGASDP